MSPEADGVKHRTHRKRKLRRIAAGEFESCPKVQRRWLKAAGALFVVAFFVVLQQIGAFDALLSRTKSLARDITGRPPARPTFADDHVFADVPTSLSAAQARRLYEMAVAGLKVPEIARESGLTVAVSSFLNFDTPAPVSSTSVTEGRPHSTNFRGNEEPTRKGLAVAQNATQTRVFGFPDQQTFGARTTSSNIVPQVVQPPPPGTSGSGVPTTSSGRPPHTSKGNHVPSGDEGNGDVSVPVVPNTQGGVFDSLGTLIAGDHQISFGVDGQGSSAVASESVSPQVVPEPNAIWLLLFGALLIGWKILRRRAAQ